MTHTRKLTLVAVLSALSFLLMFYQVSIFAVADFLKVDFSIIPILLALVMIDFKSSIGVLLIRSVLKLAINNRGLETLIGLPVNIIGVLVFVLAFALIWKNHQTTMRYILASLAGTIALTISMIVVNAVFAVPLYARFMNYDLSQIYGFWTYLIGIIAPFNLIEGVIWAVIFWLLYTVMQPILKKYEK